MPKPADSGPDLHGHGTSGQEPHARNGLAAASTVDFQAVFESAPDAYLLLEPDPPRFTMVAANDARLRATMTRREEARRVAAGRSRSGCR